MECGKAPESHSGLVVRPMTEMDLLQITRGAEDSLRKATINCGRNHLHHPDKYTVHTVECPVSGSIIAYAIWNIAVLAEDISGTYLPIHPVHSAFQTPIYIPALTDQLC